MDCLRTTVLRGSLRDPAAWRAKFPPVPYRTETKAGAWITVGFDGFRRVCIGAGSQVLSSSGPERLVGVTVNALYEVS